MRRLTLVLSMLFVFLLSSCGGNEVLNNFEARRDGTLFSSDESILIEYTTDKDGKMIDLNIDRLLTIEEMLYLNPIIDYDYEIEGFTGTIFTSPAGQCTRISNDLLVPINIEIGNTRYKYDNSVCRYRTVDSNNNFRPGFADEYYLTDRIVEDRNTTISIIVYVPDELVKFVEIYQIPHTVELLGVYSLLIAENRADLAVPLLNYYNDTGVYEQLYIKHQDNEATIAEIGGLSEELNLIDLSNLTEIVPLIDNFSTLYEAEISAMNELQEEIGVNFTTDEEPEETEEDTTN